MRAMQVRGKAGEPSLAEASLPDPNPGPDEILVRVYAAGVTRQELTWYPTTHTLQGEARQKAVPAHEFSGVVAALGPNVSGFSIGQEVFGMNSWYQDGALAEYCLTKPFFVAPKPRRLNHVEAASVPIGALTAWQGLFDRARLQSGERVLIHGASGGVGIFAVQFARRRGAHVIANAAARDREFLTGLGAETVIDYRSERFEDSAREIDVVFDAVGGQTRARSWNVLAPGGRLVTIASDVEAGAEARTQSAFFIVEPNQSQLLEIAQLLDQGELRVALDAVLSFEEAAAAYRGEIVNRTHRGKLVVAVRKAADNGDHRVVTA